MIATEPFLGVWTALSNGEIRFVPAPGREGDNDQPPRPKRTPPIGPENGQGRGRHEEQIDWSAARKKGRGKPQRPM